MSHVSSSLVGLALLMASASAHSMSFVGRAHVDVPRLWTKAFDDQRLDVALEALGDDRWRISYRQQEVSCTLTATGPRSHLVIDPLQTCRMDFDDDKFRGTVVAENVAGSLRRSDKDGERFEIHATLRAENAQMWQSAQIFGVKLEGWIPMMVPRGSARFAGTRTKR